MSDSAKQSDFKTQLNRPIRKMIIQLNNVHINRFLYTFSLRQGTVFIALHQMIISSFMLIILVVAITHLGDMMAMLHDDMEDDAEKPIFYKRDEPFTLNNNQRQFAKAQRLASVTEKLLYASTILTSIYFVCSIALLHGALQYKRGFMLVWVTAAWLAAALFLGILFFGDTYSGIIQLFGGHLAYHCICVMSILMYLYAICIVTSFVMQLTGEAKRARAADQKLNDRDDNELGEQIVLIDRTSHTTLMPVAQVQKMIAGKRLQFV